MINTYFETDRISGKSFDIKILKYIWKYLKHYKLHFYFTILVSLVASFLLISVPYVTALLIDEGVKRGIEGEIIKYGLFIFIIRISHFVFSALHMFFMQTLGAKIIHDMRVDLFRHLQGLKISYFDKNPVGRVVTRLTNDVTSVGDFFSEGVAMILFNFIFIIGAVVFLLYQNWKLGLISLSIFPLICFFSYKIAKNLREIMRIVREKLAVINAFLSEHIAGMKVVNMFSREDKVIRNFDVANKDYMFHMIEQMKLYALLTPMVTFFTGLSIALIIYFGSHQVLRGTLTIGFFVAFISYIQWIFRPIREIIEKYNIFLQSTAATEKLYKLSLIEREYDECETEILEKVVGHVEFDNVSFQYIENEKVLKNISFKIEAGQRIALVGATGSGKTTILNLINKFYSPISGNIFIDGKNIKYIERKSLREHIGKIDQTVHIFSGTVRDNITLGADISEENINEALSISNCDKIVKKFKKGLDHKISESGKNLSFGERQLISFARLVAYDPSILIMDEATSNIDSDNEKYIINAISKITRGKTSIIVAHRLSTIKNSDCIYVIDKGEIIESGSHADLLSKKGKYEYLYRNMKIHEIN